MQQPAIFKKFKNSFNLFATGQWDMLARGEMALVYPFWLVYMVIRELIRDRGLVRASSLAFTTVLSVVPLLTVATVLLRSFGNTQDMLMGLIRDQLLPFAAPQIIEQISQSVEQQQGAVGGIGSVVLIVLGVMLFNNIEGAFNDIWRISKKRPLLSKFLTFYALITLAPLLVTFSIVQTAQLQFFDELPMGATLAYKAIPVGLAWVVFALGNKLLPYTKVEWLPAIISGLLVAVAFEAAKTGFNYYINNFILETYTRVYGAIYVIPIFLVWVYICWVIVLFGAELAYTVQNLRKLLIPERIQRLARKQNREFSPLIGLEVFYPVALAFKQSKPPIRLEEVAAQASVPVEQARDVLIDLTTKNLVLRVKTDLDEDGAAQRFLPGRPLADIQVMDLILACREDIEADPHNQHFIASLHRLHLAKEEELFRGMTGETLIDPSESDRIRLIAHSISIDASSSSSDMAPDTPLGDGRAAAQVKLAAQAEDTINQMLQSASNNAEGATSPIDALVSPSPIDALAQVGPIDSGGAPNPIDLLAAASPIDLIDASGSNDADANPSPIDALATALPSDDGVRPSDNGADSGSTDAVANLNPIDALAALGQSVESPQPTGEGDADSVETS